MSAEKDDAPAAGAAGPFVAPAGSPPASGPRSLPPAYLLAYGVASGVLHLAWPSPQWVGGGWRLLALPIGVGALALVLPALREFARRGTTIRPFQQSTALVTEGVYAYSRNPMYCGLVLNLLCLAVLLGSALGFALVPIFVLHLQQRFIVREERWLEERFGDAYRDYCRRVRRWL